MQATKQITLGYKPRPFFKDFHARDKRFAVLVVHRRGGKTEAAINDLIDKALHIQWKETRPQAPPLFAYIAPLKSQAKDVIWKRLKAAVRNIPCKIYESEAKVEFTNGATIKLFGGDDPESLRGLYFDGVILDEYGDMKPDVYQIIRYGLMDYRGWIVFMGTPKGKNDFFKTLQTAKKNPDKWFHLVLRHSDTKFLPQAEIDDIIEQCEGDEDFIAQELECSFEAAIKGSYFGKAMAEVETAAKIRKVEYDPRYSVCIAMDIGRSDAMAIWFWQVIKGRVHFFKYMEQIGKDADDTIEMLQFTGYDIETVWLPHDAMHKTFRSSKSVIDVFREYNLPAKKVPDPDEGNRVFHGVNAVRRVLRAWPILFDKEECARGLECLRNYSHKWNSKTQVFSNEPAHDQWSHGADAFRYACLSIRPEDLQRSLEREARRSQELASTINNNYTWDQALKDHDRAVARERNAGRQRI